MVKMVLAGNNLWYKARYSESKWESAELYVNIADHKTRK